MAETIQPLPVHHETPDSPIAGVNYTTLMLLAFVAAAAWMASFLLPARAWIVRAESLDNWLCFGLRILRDVLRSVSFLCVAVAMGNLFPHLGAWFDRVIFRSSRAKFLLICIAISIVSSGWFAYYIFLHMPHIQDEIAMQFQAKILATGRLWAPAPKIAEFFDCEFILNNNGKWYGKYFIGQALFLVPGVWIGATWLIHPLLAGVAVWLTYALGTSLWSERLGRLAALVITIAPFRVVIFAMHLGHASSLIMLGFFALAVVKVVQNPRRWGWGFVAGISLGLAGNARPLTALAIGGAVGLIGLLAYPWRRFNLTTIVAFGIGLAIFVAVLFGYNKALTGDPKLTPFTQWSAMDKLGFGPKIGLEYWRESDKGHSLSKGLFKDVYFNLDALRANMMGWGGIVFVLCAIPLVARGYRRLGWALLAAPAAVAAIHVLHVSHGVLAGQARYWSESMPMMMVLLALGLMVARKMLPALCRWLGVVRPTDCGKTAFWSWCGVMTLWSFYAAWMPLISECEGEFWGQGPTVRDLAKSEHLDNALVFVKSGHYRSHFRGGIVDLYPLGFMLNDPDLSGPVVYARDLGHEKNAQLAALYPGRTLYRIDPGSGLDLEFLPYDPAHPPTDTEPLR